MQTGSYETIESVKECDDYFNYHTSSIQFRSRVAKQFIFIQEVLSPTIKVFHSSQLFQYEAKACNFAPINSNQIIREKLKSSMTSTLLFQIRCFVDLTITYIVNETRP